MTPGDGGGGTRGGESPAILSRHRAVWAGGSCPLSTFPTMRRRPLWMGALALFGACHPLPRTTTQFPPITAGTTIVPNTAPLILPGVERTDTSSAWVTAVGQVPLDVGLVPGLRLSGSRISTRGAIRAVVVPIAFGARLPLRSDSTLARDLFGSAVEGQESGTAGALVAASRGLFRLDASVFPTLVEPDVNIDAVLAADPSGQRLAALVTSAWRTWAARADLGAFDNDGPDGRPRSGDDDGAIDLPIILLETDSTPALFALTLPLVVPATRSGRATVRLDPIWVLAIPRTVNIARTPQIGLALMGRALGLAPAECFDVDPARLGTVALTRLGWLPTSWAGRSGTYDLAPERALAIPMADVGGRSALWLVHRTADSATVTRLMRRADGHFIAQPTEGLAASDSTPRSLPLTQAVGPAEPRLAMQWRDHGTELVLEVALSTRATAQLFDRRWIAPRPVPKTTHPTDRP